MIKVLWFGHSYPFGLTMAGISRKALNNSPENKYKYNGIEHHTDFDINMYDAFYRNLDPQIGRFWQVDPEIEAQESYSPYESMGNNPISNIDPLGDFKTKFVAKWHKFWKGGGKVGQNDYGEWYVTKNRGSEVKDNGEVVLKSAYYYGKGRDALSTAREAFEKDLRIEEDIRTNGENSMYQMYDSPEEAGNAALSLGNGMLIPNPLVKSGTIAVNLAKVNNATKKAIERLLKAGNILDRGGLTSLGRALQKHGGRTGSLFPKAIGNPATINTQAEKILTEIITNPSATTVTRHHARFGNILEYKLPNGQGARFSADGSKFIGFIE